MTTKKPFLILLGGGTCSGKNNTANSLRKDYKEPVVLDTDDFYCNDTKFQTSEEVNYNFNNPEKYQKMLEGVRNKETETKTFDELKLYYKNMIEGREKKRKLCNSLYTLIKQQYQQKGRPLKVITDWDDFLQPVKPVAIYKSHPLSVSFEQFFHNFWEGAIINPTSVGGDKLHEEYVGSEEEKNALTKFEKERQARKADPRLYAGSFYVSEERFNAPLTILAKDLLKCLKEDLISELVVMTSYRKTTTDGPDVQKFLEQERDMKKAKILKTFGKMPQCKLELTEVERDEVIGKYRPFFWEIIKKNHPDFDIYMDDSTRRILEVRDNLPSDDKIYVFPDYKCARHVIGPDIYHVKTDISDLKNEDFVKAAEEYQQKYPAKFYSCAVSLGSERKSEKPTNYALWISLGIAGLVIIGLISYYLIKKDKSK